MSDVLRLVDRFDDLAEYPACHAYVERATARPAFKKAHADQMEHFAAADWRTSCLGSMQSSDGFGQFMGPDSR